MKTTFVITLEPDLVDYLDRKTQTASDVTDYINQIVIHEKRQQEAKGLWPPKTNNRQVTTAETTP